MENLLRVREIVKKKSLDNNFCTRNLYVCKPTILFAPS